MSDEIIMWDSPEAAWPSSISGWRSRDGYFYNDERSARYSGCTHRPCESCGTPTPKMYVLCESCREDKEKARYFAMPAMPWDGKQMVYSETRDEFYSSPEDAFDDTEDDEEFENLRLVLCEPQTAPILDTDYFDSELPDDCEPPDQLLDAIDAFNEATKGLVLSWSPGKTRLKP